MPKSRLRLSYRAWRRLVQETKANGVRMNWRASIPYWFTSPFYSLLSKIQHRGYAGALQDVVPSPPIFILGFWRSGTTLLHEMLCCDSRFGFPSTYACLNPSHFLLSENFMTGLSSGTSGRRPMDNMNYSWVSPQEDEFALLALGAPSPYEALLVPALMHNPRVLLDLNQRCNTEQVRWRETFQYLLRMLTVQQKGRTLVLKSPSHGLKLATLRGLFPGARFVIIDRNPYEVFASNLRLWDTLFNLYGLVSFSMDEIENFVLEAYVLHEEAISNGCKGLDRPYVARVRYEDLVARPIQETMRLFADLEFGKFEDMRPALEGYLSTVKDHQRNVLSLSYGQRARVDARWGSIITRKGYDGPGERLHIN
jgi:omega-hydroxy-beta-dihydromenaquinone-9 sulfotransferase